MLSYTGTVRGSRVAELEQNAVQLDPGELSELVIVPEQQRESDEQCGQGPAILQ